MLIVSTYICHLLKLLFVLWLNKIPLLTKNLQFIVSCINSLISELFDIHFFYYSQFVFCCILFFLLICIIIFCMKTIFSLSPPGLCTNLKYIHSLLSMPFYYLIENLCTLLKYTLDIVDTQNEIEYLLICKTALDFENYKH